jgi:hypothetical protein
MPKVTASIEMNGGGTDCFFPHHRGPELRSERDPRAYVAAGRVGDLLLLAGPLEISHASVHHTLDAVYAPLKMPASDQNQAVAIDLFRSRPSTVVAAADDPIYREVGGFKNDLAAHRARVLPWRPIRRCVPKSSTIIQEMNRAVFHP